MKTKLIFLLISIYWGQAIYSQHITVKNSSNHSQKDYIVEIPIKKLSLSLANYVVVTEKGEELPIEVVSDLKGNQKAIFPIDQLSANATEIFSIRKGFAHKYPKRTYAELAHKIGGKFVNNKYEGGFFVG